MKHSESIEGKIQKFPQKFSRIRSIQEDRMAGGSFNRQINCLKGGPQSQAENSNLTLTMKKKHFST